MARHFNMKTNVFSPKKRLYQNEYACKAIAGASIGIMTKNGILFVAERCNTDEEFYSNIVFKLTDDIVCTVFGETSNANVLINEMRTIGQRHLLQYNEPIPCEHLVSSLCNIKQAYIQNRGKRSFGASILYMGWDRYHGYQLYQSDSSGNYSGWKSSCIGRHSAAAVTSLQQNYIKFEVTFNDNDSFLLNFLFQVLDVLNLTPEKAEIAIFTRENNKTHCSILKSNDVKELIDYLYDKNKAPAEAIKKWEEDDS